MRISVITPVHDGGDAFRACLAGLAACAPPAHELIVVVDGGSDGAAARSAAAGAKVIELAATVGPARARNIGAAAATGDVLLFIDADVVVPPGLVGRVAAHLQAGAGLAGRDWLVRRCPGRPGIPLAVPEPAAPLRAPDEPRRGDDVLVRLRRDPARGVSRRGRIQRGLQRPVDRGHRVRLSAAAGRPPGPPCERPPGDASEALDAAVAAAHRRVRARRAVDAADHPLARAAERPERQDEFARERRARVHAGGRARCGPRGCGGAWRRPCSRASASWC